MSLVDFRKRKNIPSSPVPGVFYWVENEEGTQLWFANDSRHLILLNDGFEFEEIINNLSERLGISENDITTLKNSLTPINKSIEDIQKVVDEINEKYASQDWVSQQGYLTEHQSLDDYAKKDDIPDDYLTDSDLDDYVRKDDMKDYITSSDFEGYVTEDELEERLKDISPNITEEDIEEIVEKVNSKSIELKWTEI